MSRAKVAVLGGGAWGTALALSVLRSGQSVSLWARDPAQAAQIRDGRNLRYLPDIEFEPGIAATPSLAEALAGAEVILVVLPAQALRDALSAARPFLPPRSPIVICAKGIETQTGARMSEVVSDVLPGHSPAVLSGPSFAADVSKGLPTAVTVAAADRGMAVDLASRLSGPHLRCYSSTDLVGVELGGALKNVLAIAAGAVAGAGLGASAQAAIVTRGFVELRRIGESFGARPETLMGLSGLGDLMLTCSSVQSRNFAYGLAIGRGEPLAGRPLAEGVATAGIAARIARERGLEAPIIGTVEDLLSGRSQIADAVRLLLSRPLKDET